MSRSGYTDDYDNNGELACYRGVIASATRGRRGQAFFRALVGALDEMPVKRLVASELETTEGEVCALGALAKQRGAALTTEDSYGDHDKLAATFDIAHQLAAEVMYLNDEGFFACPYREETPEERWTRMRRWAAEQIDITPDELLPESDARTPATVEAKPEPTQADSAEGTKNSVGPSNVGAGT